VDRLEIAHRGYCQVNLSRSEKPKSGKRNHAAATAFRHSLAASAREIRSVDRETKIEGVMNGGMRAEEALSGSS